MPNFLKRITVILSAVALLGAGIAPAMEHAHPHGHHGESAQLALNNGKKWATENTLRQGMNRIREALTAEFAAIHSGKATPEHYRALAEKTNGQIAFLIEHCKLEKDADAMLHLILSDIIEGADAMMSQDVGIAHEGAGSIVRALDNYGAYFDHPGWSEIRFP